MAMNRGAYDMLQIYTHVYISRRSFDEWSVQRPLLSTKLQRLQFCAAEESLTTKMLK